MLENSLENKKVIVLQQVVVAIPRLGGRCVVDCLELIEDTRWWLRAIVEKEHDPEINDGATFRCKNNRCLVIGIIIDIVAQSLQDLRRLVGREDIVAAPDFVVLGVRLHRVCRDDAEVVAASFERGKKI